MADHVYLKKNLNSNELIRKLENENKTLKVFIMTKI